MEFCRREDELKELRRILDGFASRRSGRALLALWTMTGGVARYVKLLMDARAFTRKKMIESAFALGSSYVDEGKIALGQEFGKDSGVSFSILASIACGRTSYAELRNAVDGLSADDMPGCCALFATDMRGVI